MKVRFGFQFCREGRCRGEARRSCSLSFHSLHSLHSRCFPTESSRLKPLPQASDQPVGPQSSASASSPAPATILMLVKDAANGASAATARSEEHTSELQSLMRISYAVFCLKKKKLI